MKCTLIIFKNLLMKLKIHTVLSVLLFVLTAGSIGLHAQKANKNQRTIMFYNVENLYDTINDPSIDDEEFLPEAKKKWNTERYNKKLIDLAKVIESVSPTI
ncbi:MAG TPA: hypothetical protein DCQ31_03385, partial [Bacteroidales bacterium]|nr:hypothetical protein [Bacteroidales bacterium]